MVKDLLHLLVHECVSYHPTDDAWESPTCSKTKCLFDFNSNDKFILSPFNAKSTNFTITAPAIQIPKSIPLQRIPPL